MKGTAFFITSILLILSASFVNGQQRGCTDPKAINFSSSATENDGSCNYLPIVVTPTFAFELPAEVRETSGLVFFDNLLWTHNDSGHLPVLYALDTATNEIVRRLTLSNAKNVDWEEITMDDNYLYIGDFGNNAGARKNLVIYRLKLEKLLAKADTSVTAEKIYFSYPDQESFERSRTHNFDCEAFIAHDGNLYLFTKNRGDQQTKLYRLPALPGEYVAEYLDSFDSKGLITASAYNAEANELVLLGYVNQVWTPFMWILYDFEAPDFFGGNKRRIDFINLVTTQTEGICYVEGKELMISAEQSPTFSARAFRFSTAPYTDHIGFDASDRQGRTVLIINEEALLQKTLELIIRNPRRDSARIDIIDRQGNILVSSHFAVQRRSDNHIHINLDGLPAGDYKAVYFAGRQTLATPFLLP